MTETSEETPTITIPEVPSEPTETNKTENEEDKKCGSSKLVTTETEKGEKEEETTNKGATPPSQQQQQQQQQGVPRKGRLNFPRVPNREAILGFLETGNAKFSILKDSVNFEKFRVYFQVSLPYVTEKLKRVLCPHLFCDENTLWAQRHVRGHDGKGTCAPPAADPNALDFYVPLMAFATYTLLCVMVYGLAGLYSPVLVEAVATKAACIIGIETLLVKGGLTMLTDYEMGLVNIAGYCGYVFVGVCLNVVASVVLGYKLSLVVMCFTALEMACFLKRSLSVLVMRSSHVMNKRDINKGPVYSVRTKQLFIALVCILQFVVSYFLSYHY